MKTSADRQAQRDGFVKMYASYPRVVHERMSDGTEASIYATRGPSYGLGRERFTLLAFIGSSGKPCIHSVYKQQGWATSNLCEFIAAHQRHLDAKRATAQKRAEFRTTLEVGNVLESSWGYDQTNIDFYEVVEVSPCKRFVSIRKIDQGSVATAWCQEDVWPRTGVYLEAATRHRVLPGDSVKVRDWGVWASLWRGRVRHATSYA